MKKSINAALAITTLSILLPGAFIRAQDASTTTQRIAVQTQRLQGSWEGVLIGPLASYEHTIHPTRSEMGFDFFSTFCIRAWNGSVCGNHRRN
jgi:hypothetical protein